MGNRGIRDLAAGNLIVRILCCVVLAGGLLWSGSPGAQTQESETEEDLRSSVAAGIASMSWEPSCLEVVSAALETLTPPLTHVPTPRRMRASALLPRLKVSIYKSLEHDESLDSESDGDLKIGIDTDNDLEIRGYLEWDLSKLVFNPAESGAASKRLADLKWRADVAAEVTSIYHERMKLAVLLVIGVVTDPVEQLTIIMRVEELTALLDSYTKGWFGRELAKRMAKEVAVPTSFSSSSVSSP